MSGVGISRGLVGIVSEPPAASIILLPDVAELANRWKDFVSTPCITP